MKPELQKIAAKPRQLATSNANGSERPSSKLGERTSSKSQLPTDSQERPPSATSKVEPFWVQQKQVKKTPDLPKVKSPGFTSHRNGVNPYLAMNLIKEMETVVGRWQTELRQILRQIEDIYLEGPIIEGWLESESPQIPAQVAAQQRRQKGLPTAKASGYRLVGQDANGKFWSRPCPPKEVPSISMAIARYQKLQNLLVRKQELETNLTELAEVLVVVQGHIQTL